MRPTVCFSRHAKGCISPLNCSDAGTCLVALTSEFSKRKLDARTQARKMPPGMIFISDEVVEVLGEPIYLVRINGTLRLTEKQIAELKLSVVQ